MEFKVRLYLDGKLIDPSDYSKVVISSRNIDRIVNRIYNLSLDGQLDVGSETETDEETEQEPIEAEQSDSGRELTVRGGILGI